MGNFAGRLGTRFLVVTVVPNVLLLGYLGFLLAAGAPGHLPSPGHALRDLDDLTLNRIVAVTLGVLVVSVASHPLQLPLIQLLEGYYWPGKLGTVLADRATERFRHDQEKALYDLPEEDGLSANWTAKYKARAAQARLNSLPEHTEDLLPTALGNVLWRGETSAGQPYGLELLAAWPRLVPFVPPDVLAEINDRRNQLDAAIRLCVASGIATAASVGLLLRDGPWLFLALGTYLLCWACYRAAIAASRGYSISLATAVDLYHLRLFDGLALERPANLMEEIRRNEVLMKVFRREALGPRDKGMFQYIAAKDGSPADPAAKASSE
ncbi:MAG TPA: hypothetical protein VMA72_04575 [Streptosporangiaceae bacterium]|nr:hypothetical protein [Streptosporangiaceae bacterium]